jgi:hypothetical protein
MCGFKSVGIISIIVSVIFITGCNKNDLTTPEAAAEVPVLCKISQDDGSYAEYSYSNGFLSEYKFYSSGALNKTVQLKYNSDGLTEYQINDSPINAYKLQFHFDSNKKTTKADVYVKSDTSYFSTGYLLFTYDANKRIIKIEQYNEYYDTPWTHTDITYDQAGNILSYKTYLGEAPYIFIEYEYDGKNNPLSGYRNYDLFTILFGPNNITKKTETEYYTGGSYITETGYTYTYNSSGYPVSKKAEKRADGSTTTQVETYKYE